jgi:tyrosine decarboxylase
MKREFNTNDTNLKALFLGDKGENAALMKDLMIKLLDEHVGWRQNYMPQDPACISVKEQRSPSFLETRDHMISVLDELSSIMRTESLPWHNAGRYWGHMCSETLMPAMLAHTFAMLWNPNNCATEASPATARMEIEVGEQFARLMGYEKGWGHITCDGSIANLEAMWYARNVKSIPLSLKEVAPELVAGKDEWQLLNMSVDEVMDILDTVPDKLDEIKAHSVRSGKNMAKLGKFLVPETKHYSWLKAADISGVGLDNLVDIKVTYRYEMDMEDLERKIRELAGQRIPIMGVVAVVGTTEEGQVDPVHKVVALREKLAKEGIYFYIHVDAAYGGYGRTIFMDENDQFIPYEDIDEMYKKHNVFQGKNEWLDKSIYDAYKGIEGAESVTIDPHKMGYVPYAAGGIAIRRESMKDLISYFAAYVFEKGDPIPALLGAYILEGSKSGAIAAAVWAAHKVLPLNITGFGKLIGASIEGAYRFYNYLWAAPNLCTKYRVSGGGIVKVSYTAYTML